MRSPSERPAPLSEITQPVVVAQNRDVATREDKTPRPTRSSDRRATQQADEVAKATPTADSASKVVAALGNANAARETPAPATAGAPAQRQADSLSAVSRAERDRPAPPAPTFMVGGVARVLPATNWPVISRRMAKSILGEEPVGLPGLATRNFRRVPGTEGTVVVEQALDSSTVIQIFQRPAYPYDSSGSGYANEGRLRPRAYSTEDQARARGNRLFARYVKGLRVEITGPLSTDSLNRLLDQIVPLP
jgi:hypothetical protein